MAQTKDELRAADLDKREAFLKNLQAQLQRDGQHLYEDAKAKVAKDRAALDQREAALAPQLTAVKEREAKVSILEADLRQREEAVKKQGAAHALDAKLYAQRNDALTGHETAMKEKIAQHQRLREAELALLSEKRALLDRDFSVREQHLVATQESLAERETALQKQSVAIQEQQEKANHLLKTADQRDRETVTRETQQRETSQERERVLNTTQSQLTKREADVKALVKTLRVQEEELAAKSAAFDARLLGQQKAKADIEIKAAQVEKLARIVKTLIKQKSLQSELEGMVSPADLENFLS